MDQTRGWFYSLLAISTLLFNKAPYRNVIVLGHVQDENGQKMSKSKGNAVDPFEALATYGADAIRWYFYSNSAPWLPNRFHAKAVQEGQRKFLSTLWNTYAFFVLYANIDGFDATKYSLDSAKLTVMDKWLLSKLNSLILEVDADLNDYKIPETARALQDFVDELSNWYVRRGRERYWGEGMTDDKIAAYMTLYTALVTVSKLAAPMIPFMTEDIYRNLVCSLDPSAPESVHLCDFPKADERWIDKKLEEDMEEVLQVVTLGRAARNAVSIKNRQPLAKIFVMAEHPLDVLYQDIVKDELNVKEFAFTQDVSEFTAYTFKPQLKLLGQKYGKRIGEIRNALAALDGGKSKKELDQNGVLVLPLTDGEISLTPEELLIDASPKPGFAAESDRGVTVVLDTTLTDALIEEGFVREIISKIQSMRKEADFNVTDHIAVYQTGSEKIARLLTGNQKAIAGDVLAEEFHVGEMDGFTMEWDINGEKTTLGVKVVG